jgi:hypothetical protein
MKTYRNKQKTYEAGFFLEVSLSVFELKTLYFITQTRSNTSDLAFWGVNERIRFESCGHFRFGKVVGGINKVKVKAHFQTK